MIPVLAVLWAAPASHAQQPPPCEAGQVEDAKAQIAERCPCDAKENGEPWRNHGEYVSCVARARRAVANETGVPRRCLKDVVFCAADSTCGNAGAVTCTKPVGVCLGDASGGDGAQEGTCDNDPSTPCDTNADCAIESCTIGTSEQCTRAAGREGTGSCCPQSEPQ